MGTSRIDLVKTAIENSETLPKVRFRMAAHIYMTVPLFPFFYSEVINGYSICLLPTVRCVLCPM